MPSSSVLVATITQSRASANASSARRRSSSASELCDTNVATLRSRSSTASCSTRARLSQNTSRFSPRCNVEITCAALWIEPTWSRVSSGAAGAPPSGETTSDRRVLEPFNQRSNDAGSPTVAERPILWMSRPVTRAIRSSTASRCQPRSSPPNAWISSTTTTRTLAKIRSCSTLREINITSSDSGVVSSTSGGSSRIRSRAPPRMSPCHSAARRPTMVQ
ncbi:unannotated protein [freshwater metagenome]|uniref:Unannotated protein n=1 Tax=freshwater metagenome TaxID=449393 RepID=A0A6J7ATD7_9ZZZZ